MKAAGIDRSEISTILISHFHPDHVWGLMEKGTNAAVFPDAELVVNAAEYRFWTEPGRVEKLPEGRRAAGKRIADVFPTWKNWRLVENGAEVAARHRDPRGLRPHAGSFRLPRDVRQRPADGLERHDVCAGAPRAASGLAGRLRPGRADGGHDAPQIIDRVIADKMMICGAHFPFPGAGAFVKDGNAYAFTPVLQS